MSVCRLPQFVRNKLQITGNGEYGVGEDVTVFVLCSALKHSGIVWINAADEQTVSGGWAALVMRQHCHTDTVD